jgi:hypothetical protein
MARDKWMRDASIGIRDASFKSRIPDPESRILDLVTRIPHPELQVAPVAHVLLTMPQRNSDFDAVSLRPVVVLFVVLASLWLLPQLSSAEEGWSLEGQGILFYTDDVGLFSATRRLSRDGDPTQPAIDSKLTDQGSDVVFEPLLSVTRSLTNSLGRLNLNVQGQGFVFTENPEFNHGTLRLQATQDLSSATRIQARFSYAPDQFLGDNEERQSGQQQLSAEELTSYIWSTRLIHDVTPDVSVKLLGRYGMRRYNDAFSERNTDFWTIGPHVDWRVAPKIKLGLSYHYERGLAEGRKQPQFEDDTSYINHYLSADVDVELTERLSLLTAFHFEHNIWTSGLAGDERNGAYENVYQGEVLLAYRLTESIQGFGGVQRSSRKESFESSSIKNTNVGLGLSMRF